MIGPEDSRRTQAFVATLLRGRRSHRLLGVGSAIALLAGILVGGLVIGPVSAVTSPATAPLTVTKVCVPDDGHNGVFNLRVDGRTVLANAACGASRQVTLSAGRHIVSETGGTNTTLSSYRALIGGACATDGTIRLVANTPATCTITNTRKTTLTVAKVCVPITDGGEFNLRVDGATVLGNAHCGRRTTVTETPGVVHTVSETAGYGTTLADYAGLIGGDCATDGTITLTLGQAATCTITNTRIPPATAPLTVTKVCVPDDGQNGVFNLRVDGRTVLANAACGASTLVTLTVGKHMVSENGGTNTSLSSYAALIGGACAANGTVTLVADTPATCTITNTRKPTMTVTKICVPDPAAAQFDILVDGSDRGDVSCAAGGVRTIRALTLDVGTHTLGEEADGTTKLADYKASYACTNGTIDPVSGVIALVAGQSVACTITNARTDTFTADLQITKTDGTDVAIAGSTITYTIVVTNAGPADVVGAKVDDTSPFDGFAWTAVQTGGASGFTADNSVAPFPTNIHDTVDMPSGSTITYTAKMDTNREASSAVNTATVTAPTGTVDPDLTNNSATDSDTLTEPIDLSITKDDGVTTVSPGDPVTYTIVIGNPSAWPAGFTLTDTVPASLSNVTWTAVESGCPICFPTSGSGSINQGGTLPPGDTLTVTLTGTLAADASGNLENTATVTLVTGTPAIYDPDLTNNSAIDTDTILTADLQITKTDGTDVAIAGSTITYTIVVTNAGPADVVGAKVD
ncbi:MAG: hypothetical protein ACHQZR_06205, partial [Candidatus Limnocylindrales bacterium]